MFNETKTETRTNKGTKRGENEAGNKTEDGENKHWKTVKQREGKQTKYL